MTDHLACTNYTSWSRHRPETKKKGGRETAPLGYWLRTVFLRGASAILFHVVENKVNVDVPAAILCLDLEHV
jgi:hypothetical protein